MLREHVPLPFHSRLVRTIGCMDTGAEGSAIELLTVKEVASLLKLSVPGVRELQAKRHLPFIKVGGAVRFERRDIVEYLKLRKVVATL